MSWFGGESKKIRTNDLLPTGEVDPDRVQYFQKKGKGHDLPVGYVEGNDGKLYVVDGNHRVMAHIANADEWTNATKVEMPDDVKKKWFNKAFGKR